MAKGKKNIQDFGKIDELLQTITDASPVGIIIFDCDARVIHANAIAEQFFGQSGYVPKRYKCGDFIGCVHRYLDPQGCGHTDQCSLCPLPCAIRATLEGEANSAVLEGEALIEREPDHPNLWVKFKTKAVKMKRLATVVMAIEDITAYKQADAELRESERRYRRIVENISDVVWIADLDLNNIYVSQSIERMMGEPVAAYMKKPIEKRFSPESLNKVHAILLEELVKEKDPNMDKGRTRLVELEHYRADGSTMWVSMNVSFLRDDNGNPVGIQGVTRDINERKRAEEELKLNERCMATLLKLSQMGDQPVNVVTDFALERAVEITGSRIGYFAFVNEDETVMTMYSWSQEAMKECKTSDKPRVYPVAATGLWGEAVRQRKPIITNEYEAPNHLKKEYPDGHVPILRHMNIPLLDEGRIVLVAGVGNKKKPYDDGDVQGLTLLMDGLWKMLKAKREAMALRETESRTRRQREALAYLAVHPMIAEDNVQEAVQRITETISETIGVERASVWMLFDDGSQLQCLSLYEAGKRAHRQGEILNTADFPRYLETIRSESRVCVQDAQNDPRSSELADNHLIPLGITSLLGAGIRKDEKLAGVFSLEHTGEKRKWHADEEAFANTAAALVAQVLANAERRQAMAELQKSEEMLRKSQEAAGIGSYSVDIIEDTCWGSNVLNDVLGIPQIEKHPLEVWPALIHPQWRERVMQAHDYALANVTRFDQEYKIIRQSDGKERWVHDIGTFGVDDQGRPIRLVGTMKDITERKEMVAQISAITELYQSVVDTQTEMICRYLPDTTLTFVNPAYCSAFEKSSRELIGQKYLMFLPQELHAGEIKSINSLTSEKPIQTREYRILLPDGGTVWQEWTDHARFNEYGQIMEIQGIGRDVTDRKEAEENLRKVSSLLTETNRMARIGGWELNPLTEEFEWTETTREIHEVGPDFIPDLRNTVNFYEEDESRKRMIKAFTRCMEKGDPFDIEVGIITAKGNKLWARAMGKAEFRNGDCTRLFGTFQDITSRKHMEDELRKNEQYLTHLFNANPTIIYTLNPQDLSPEWISPNVVSLLGYSIEEALQPNWWHDHLHPQDRERALSTSATIFDKEQVFYEYRLLKKNGEAIWINDEFRALRDEKGSLVEIIGAWSDVTARKNAEIEHDKLRDQFIQAQKMESVGRLAGGVAHDYNNMLSVIMGYSELALGQVQKTDSIYEDLHEIRNAAKRSAEITRQLLAFARKQTISPSALDLNEILQEMLKMLHRLIGEDIDIQWHPGKQLWQVNIDPSQIDQITVNLCVNARDAIDGVGKITIETNNISIDEAYCAVHERFVPGEYVLLAVSDDGCGMDKETLENIFEPFFTTKGIGKGTGLGLATIYGIVKQNGGFINVYSEPGKGTTFRIYLTRHISQGDETGEESKQPIIESRGVTILLVEDELMLKKLAKTMLEKLGHQVFATGTPKEAIHLAEEHNGKIDLLVTDVVMPGMNGRELSKSLLTIYPGLKTLFMSGYTSNVIAHHGILEKDVVFIQKPFSIQDLATKIRKALA